MKINVHQEYNNSLSAMNVSTREMNDREIKDKVVWQVAFAYDSAK